MKTVGRGKLSDLLIRLAHTCRKLGLNVGTSEIVEAERILETYASLKGGKLRLAEMREVVKAVFAKRVHEERVFEEAWSRVTSSNEVFRELLDKVEEHLRTLRIGYGERIYSKRALVEGADKATRERRRRAYRELKKMGIIVRRGGREVVLPRRAAMRRIAEISRKAHSASEALNRHWLSSLEEGRTSIDPEMLRDAEIPDRTLNRLGTDRLAELGMKAWRVGNKKLAYRAAKRLASLVTSGTLPKDTETTIQLLQLTGTGNLEIYLKLAGADPAVVSRMAKTLGPEVLASHLSSLDRESIKRVLPKLARLLSPDETIRLVGSLPLDTLARLPRSALKDTGRANEAFITAARHVSEAQNLALRYLETMNEAYLNYALHEYSKAKEILDNLDPRRLAPPLRPLYSHVRSLAETLGRPTSSPRDLLLRLAPSISRMDLHQAFRLLSNLYTSPDPEVRREAYRLAQRIWHARATLLKSTILRKWRKTGIRGRVELRETVYRMVRMQQEPLVYRRRRRSPGIVLVVDRSGSMVPYATWAILTASAFSRNVRRLILFGEDVDVIEVSKGPRRLVDLLLSARFGGYTNISAAMLEATRDLPPATLVLISDLKQTVQAESPVRVVERLIRSRWRIVVVAPPSRDLIVEEALRERGVRVEVVRTPWETGKRLARYLW